MGILSWLRGPPTPAERVSVDGDFLRIPSRNYFGWYSASPDGRYAITWRDSDDEGTRGGARQSGMGRHFLIEGGAIIAEGRVERPNDGKVADNGTFVINDWGFSGDLAGVFHAFRADGSPILAQAFSANLYNNGLAADGRLAVCQTCNSHTEDASVLAVFDLAAGLELARWVPESGWAQSYDFPADGRTVQLRYPGGASFAYALDGAFIDRELWITWSLAQGSLNVVNRLLHSSEDKPSPDLAKRLVAAIDVALATTSDDHARAWAYKMRGICLEAEGSVGEALRCYDEALRLNPKVGAKRRADALRKSSA